MQIARIVNKAFAGMPEHPVLQIDSNKTFEFSKIIGESITDKDISHPTIQKILNRGHWIEITFDENDNITLHF